MLRWSAKLDRARRPKLVGAYQQKEAGLDEEESQVIETDRHPIVEQQVLESCLFMREGCVVGHIDPNEDGAEKGKVAGWEMEDLHLRSASYFFGEYCDKAMTERGGPRSRPGEWILIRKKKSTRAKS